jgi:hypothetical protein
LAAQPAQEAKDVNLICLPIVIYIPYCVLRIGLLLGYTPVIPTGLSLITLLTVQQVAQEMLPAGFGQDPGSGNKGRVMAGVLLMAASQHSPPITDFILFKGNDLLFHKAGRIIRNTTYEKYTVGL